MKMHLCRKERQQLQDLTTKGQHKSRVVTRARILILSDKGLTNAEIIRALNVSRVTVWRVKKRYEEEGVPACLSDKPRPGQPRLYSDQERAEIIALACTTPPKGARRWSLQLLVDKLGVRPGKKINHESIRLILKKAGRSLG